MKSAPALLAIGIASAIVYFSSPDPAVAQFEKVDVKVGDKVQVQWFKEWYDGEVTSIIANGMRAKVRFKDNRGRERDWPFGYKDIRKTSSKPAKPKKVAKLRVWTSSDGEFTIKAIFAGEADDKVRLKKEDGKTIAVPLSSLSKADNAYVVKMREAAKSSNPFDHAEEVDPKDASPAEPKSTAGKSSFAAYPFSEYDASQAKPISLGTDTPFKARPESLSEPAFNKDSISVNGMSLSGGKNDNFVFNRDQSKVVFSWQKGFAGREGLGFSIVDTATGKSLGEISVPMPKTSVVDINSDGTLVLTQSMTFSKQPRLDIWKLADGKIQHHLAWQLPKKDATPGAKPKFAAFTADDQVVTIADSQQIVFWNIDKLAPVAFCNKGDHFYSVSNNGFAISRDRKTLYLIESGRSLKGGSLVALDLQTREPLGRTQIDFNTAAVAVSRSGKKVALLGNKVIQVFDGELNKTDEFTTTFNSFFNKVQFLDDQFLMCIRGGDATLIDLKTRVPVWTYKFSNWFNSGFLTTDLGGYIWEGSGKSFQRTKLPHQGALDKLPTDPESQRVFREGMTIFLDLRIGSGKVYDNYAKQFTDLGLKVVRDPKADLVLIATRTTGKPQTTEYRVIGDPFGPKTETVTTRSTTLSVDVYQKGERVWGVSGGSSGGAPSFLSIGQGETAQSAVNRLNGSGGTGEGFFGSIKFIKNVIKQPYGGALGQSVVQGGSITDRPFPKPQNNRNNGPGRGGLVK